MTDWVVDRIRRADPAGDLDLTTAADDPTGQATLQAILEGQQPSHAKQPDRARPRRWILALGLAGALLAGGGIAVATGVMVERPPPVQTGWEGGADNPPAMYRPPFAPGQPLHCSGILGMTKPEAEDALAALGLSVAGWRYTNHGNNPAATPPPNAVVSAAFWASDSKHAIVVFLTDPSSYSELVPKEWTADCQ